MGSVLYHGDKTWRLVHASWIGPSDPWTPGIVPAGVTSHLCDGVSRAPSARDVARDVTTS
jgi:hypothetical protein